MQALGAAVVGGVLVIVCVALVTSGHGGFLTDVLSRPTSSGQSPPLDIVIVSMIALLTVADIAGRKWISPIATVVVSATVLTTFLSGLVTLTALLCSLLLGWLVGLAFRVGFGAASTRPPGVDVARVLLDTGVPLERLRLVDANAAGDRRYAGTTASGSVDVHVIDRDTFGLASGRRLLRAVRLRSGFSRPPAVTLRSELEHRTLMGLWLADAGIHHSPPVAVSEVGPFAAVIAYVHAGGDAGRARRPRRRAAGPGLAPHSDPAPAPDRPSWPQPPGRAPRRRGPGSPTSRRARIASSAPTSRSPPTATTPTGARSTS